MNHFPKIAFSFAMYNSDCEKSLLRHVLDEHIDNRASLLLVANIFMQVDFRNHFNNEIILRVTKNVAFAVKYNL